MFLFHFSSEKRVNIVMNAPHIKSEYILYSSSCASFFFFFFFPNELCIMHSIIFEKPTKVMAPTAAGKLPENNAARAGKRRAAHRTLLEVENESFGSQKHLLCSNQHVGMVKERRLYERHTFMPVTSNLLIYLFLLRDAPPLCSCRASKRH